MARVVVGWTHRRRAGPARDGLAERPGEGSRTGSLREPIGPRRVAIPARHLCGERSAAVLTSALASAKARGSSLVPGVVIGGFADQGAERVAVEFVCLGEVDGSPGFPAQAGVE